MWLFIIGLFIVLVGRQFYLKVSLDRKNRFDFYQALLLKRLQTLAN